MGSVVAKSGFSHSSAPPGPDVLNPPTFDPNYGFPNGRQPRVMVATEEEMEAAKLPMDQRDYCAHHLLKFQICRREVWPFVVKCKHERHVLEECQYKDYVIRMKEYEREKRLLERQQRKEKKNEE